MQVLGIDLAAEPANTGVVVLTPGGEGFWVAKSVPRATDEVLVSAAIDVDVIGVDSPLGWPVAFVDAVVAHQRHETWPGTNDRSTLTHRDTDRAVHRLGVGHPLSVSADKLGSVAMRCALLQHRWAEVWGRPEARDGSGRLVETYPAAAMAAWGIACRGYKSRNREVDSSAIRRQVVETIGQATSAWLDLGAVEHDCVASDHVLDALVCTLVGVSVKAGATHQPTDTERVAAAIEGWIHVPSRPLAAISPTPPFG